MISVDSVVTISPQQVACDLENEKVVLSLSNGSYYGLDPVGARIWELLHERRAVSEIRDTLLLEYGGVDAEQCTSDLLAFLEQLVTWDLVEIEQR